METHDASEVWNHPAGSVFIASDVPEDRWDTVHRAGGVPYAFGRSPEAAIATLLRNRRQVRINRIRSRLSGWLMMLAQKVQPVRIRS